MNTCTNAHAYAQAQRKQTNLLLIKHACNHVYMCKKSSRSIINPDRRPHGPVRAAAARTGDRYRPAVVRIAGRNLGRRRAVAATLAVAPRAPHDDDHRHESARARAGQQTNRHALCRRGGRSQQCCGRLARTTLANRHARGRAVRVLILEPEHKHKGRMTARIRRRQRKHGSIHGDAQHSADRGRRESRAHIGELLRAHGGGGPLSQRPIHDERGTDLTGRGGRIEYEFVLRPDRNRCGD